MTDLDHILSVGMSALVQNPETRQAIVEYIKVLTGEHKPKEQWREVWYQQTDYARIGPREDRFTMQKNSKHRLLVVALWNQESRAGKILALLSGEYDYRNYKWQSQWNDLPLRASNELANKSAIYEDYPDVIKSAQQFWTEALTIWHEKTSPLTEDTK